MGLKFHIFRVAECYTECGTFRLSLPLRFYVKSIFGSPEWRKITNFPATQILREINFALLQGAKIGLLTILIFMIFFTF